MGAEEETPLWQELWVPQFWHHHQRFDSSANAGRVAPTHLSTATYLRQANWDLGCKSAHPCWLIGCHLPLVKVRSCHFCTNLRCVCMRGVSDAEALVDTVEPPDPAVELL